MKSNGEKRKGKEKKTEKNYSERQKRLEGKSLKKLLDLEINLEK